MTALPQEIVSVYPLPPALMAHASNRVFNALALLQCVASHSETRQLFLSGHFSCLWRLCGTNVVIGHIPLFLYPFLNTMSKTRPFKYHLLVSLGCWLKYVPLGMPYSTLLDRYYKQNDNFLGYSFSPLDRDNSTLPVRSLI